MKDAYTVVVDEPGCATCGRFGGMWTIEGPDGVCIGQSFMTATDAEELAELLNDAFLKGVATADLPDEREEPTHARD